MELNLRPMTEAERLYCYGQSQQIMARPGASVTCGPIWTQTAEAFSAAGTTT